LSWIKRAPAAIRDPKAIELHGEVRASHRVPVLAVVRVIEMFREAQYPRVHGYTNWIPRPSLRKLKTLPPPRRNYVPRSVNGWLMDRENRHCKRD
jgi:hypothetical protein